jgi:dGTPase
MIRDLISTSADSDGELCLRLSDEVLAAMMDLRQFLYENVYRSPSVHKDFEKSKKILSELYHYFSDNSSIFEKKLNELQMNSLNHDDQPKGRTVCDFIASMTDRYAMNLYRKIFFPSPLV